MLLIAFSYFACFFFWKLLISLNSFAANFQDLRVDNCETNQKFGENENVTSTTKQFKFKCTNICFHKYITNAKSKRLVQRPSLPNNFYLPEHNIDKIKCKPLDEPPTHSHNGEFDLNNNGTSLNPNIIPKNQNQKQIDLKKRCTDLDMNSQKNVTTIPLVNQQSNESQQSDSVFNPYFEINLNIHTDLSNDSAVEEIESGPHMNTINWHSTLDRIRTQSKKFAKNKHIDCGWQAILMIFGKCFGIRKS